MTKLPEGMWARVVRAAPIGRVEAIAVRPVRREPAVATTRWTPSDGQDHGKAGDRAVTLIQAEHLEAMAAMLGREVDFLRTRRNLLVSGFNLGAVQRRRFRVGALVLEGTEACHPCARMASTFGEDGYTAMVGHGGLCCRIIELGEVSVGDTVELVEAAP